MRVGAKGERWLGRFGCNRRLKFFGGRSLVRRLRGCTHAGRSERCLQRAVAVSGNGGYQKGPVSPFLVSGRHDRDGESRASGGRRLPATRKCGNHGQVVGTERHRGRSLQRELAAGQHVDAAAVVADEGVVERVLDEDGAVRLPVSCPVATGFEEATAVGHVVLGDA